MSWSGCKVLVTGAGGFIGSHLAERLTRDGVTVRAFVHYGSMGTWGWLDHSPLKASIEVVRGDISDRDSVDRAVRGVDTVFHLAALIGIPYSYEAPESYVRVNIQGTLNVLQAARAHDAKVVHTSTSEVYGTALRVPIDENHPLQGQSPYSATKIGADKLAESFNLSFGMPVVTVRPFNTYGPRQSARAVIPTIITQLLAGARLRLGNLATTRDFNFVADTIDGFVRAGRDPRAIGRVINLGTGREISIGDLAATIGRLLGREPEIAVDAERLRPPGSEVDRLLADARLAHELLDWEPRVDLESGLQQTIAWLDENASRYKPDSYAV
jgi:NAD dependent epimerase/dehydratase